MRGKQAKILSDDNVHNLLPFVETSRYPLRNKVTVLLSTKSGLRAAEISQLTWAMVTDPTGAIGMALELPDRAAKKSSGRVIPLHQHLRTALAALRVASQSAGPVKASVYVPSAAARLAIPRAPTERRHQQIRESLKSDKPQQGSRYKSRRPRASQRLG